MGESGETSWRVVPGTSYGGCRAVFGVIGRAVQAGRIDPAISAVYVIVSDLVARIWVKSP